MSKISWGMWLWVLDNKINNEMNNHIQYAKLISYLYNTAKLYITNFNDSVTCELFCILTGLPIILKYFYILFDYSFRCLIEDW